MISPLQLGASLYVPATRPDLLAVGNRRKYPALRSVIFCTEDAILPRQVPEALNNLAAVLRRLDPSPLLCFVRVRNPAVLRQVLAMDGVRRLAGFVVPKATRHNLPEYLAAFKPDDHFRVMATLETVEVFDPAEMAALRNLLLRDADQRLLTLRVGGNDLLQLLGLRRPRERSIYATPLGPVIAHLVTVFRPYGFNLTGPVYEYLDRSRGLAREVRRDLACGLFGKGAVHPDQVPVIEAEYCVSDGELRAAERVVAADADAVFRLDGAMCEPATHRRWAESVIERARLYGVRPGGTRVRSPSTAGGNGVCPPGPPVG